MPKEKNDKLKTDEKENLGDRLGKVVENTSQLVKKIGEIFTNKYHNLLGEKLVDEKKQKDDKDNDDALATAILKKRGVITEQKAPTVLLKDLIPEKSFLEKFQEKISTSLHQFLSKIREMTAKPKTHFEIIKETESEQLEKTGKLQNNLLLKQILEEINGQIKNPIEQPDSPNEEILEAIYQMLERLTLYIEGTFNNDFAPEGELIKPEASNLLDLEGKNLEKRLRSILELLVKRTKGNITKEEEEMLENEIKNMKFYFSSPEEKKQIISRDKNKGDLNVNIIIGNIGDTTVNNINEGITNALRHATEARRAIQTREKESYFKHLYTATRLNAKAQCDTSELLIENTEKGTSHVEAFKQLYRAISNYLSSIKRWRHWQKNK